MKLTCSIGGHRRGGNFSRGAHTQHAGSELAAEGRGAGCIAESRCALRPPPRSGRWRGPWGTGLLGALLFFAVLTFVRPAHAVVAAPAEYQLRDAWAGPFRATVPTGLPAHLVMVEEDVADGVGRGQSWRGTPFQIGDRTYPHGIAFNATKRLRVRLDRPAARFSAEVGLENNDDTRRGATLGNGSVTFHVFVGAKEVFASPVLRLKDGPVAVSLPLDGAKEFDLRVGDGGDGRGWDQALWGGAEVELEDGTRLRVQDLPWAEAVDTGAARLSFVYDGRPSSAFLPQWKREARQTALPGGGESQEVVFQDPATGLEVRVSARLFADFPAVEWVTRFRNTGPQDSPAIENIQALEAAFALPTAGPPTLHWANGGVASFDDFAPHATELKPGVPFTLGAKDGRSSSEVLPFFNLEGAGGGVVLAVGWSGRWAATFEAGARGSLRARAGMARTRFVLHPGEEVRTPSMLALFYRGDRWRGQNLLRQFILAHHRPTRSGEPLRAPITCGNWGGTHVDVHLDNVEKIIRERLPIEYYWIDAEWYGNPTGDASWPVNVGNWAVKTNLYPRGFKPLSEALRATGRELMLWFEPERVYTGTPWHREHRDWLLDAGGSSFLFNLGLPEARRFLTDFISSRIGEFGLGCYRQDFNMDPASYWAKADAPDRQGLAEIRHVEGLYAYWDDLVRRHPHLIIDNCASGGRRIDLETVGRATPFWRTDGPRDAIAHQCHTYGLLAWVPFSATSQDRASDDYEFRSSMCSSLCLNWWHESDGPARPIRADFPFDWARRTLEQYLAIRDFYYGDYYPLTGYSKAADLWMAYQLDRPDRGDGLVVALRRPQSPYESGRFVLRGIEPAARYAVTNLDTKEAVTLEGSVLMDAGLPVKIAVRPGSALLVYRKAGQ